MMAGITGLHARVLERRLHLLRPPSPPLKLPLPQFVCDRGQKTVSSHLLQDASRGLDVLGDDDGPVVVRSDL
jgi:hypothetical protein